MTNRNGSDRQRLLTLLLCWVCLAGATLSAQAAIFTPTNAFTDNGNGTVTHQLTGLTWMRCSMGQSWTGSTCSGTAATYGFDQAAALSSSFAGHNDWRLPSPWELTTIVDYGVAPPGPTVNGTVFPNAPTSIAWSSSPHVNVSGSAWGVYFNYGDDYFFSKTSANVVRLVRGQPSFGTLTTPTSDFIDNGNGTVTHSRTRLTWMRCAKGQSWARSTCGGTAATYDWYSASALIDNFAGFTDWRLPNVQELHSIVEYGSSAPASNVALFINTPSSPTWSSSSFASDTSNAWAIDFSGGGILSRSNYDSYPVRLVRGTQSAPSFPLTVVLSGAGYGSISANAGYISCYVPRPGVAYVAGPACSDSFGSGTVVTLTAVPDTSDSSFAGWSGAGCSGTGSTCIVTISAAQSVTASFELKSASDTTPDLFSFTAQSNISPGATVTSNTITVQGINASTSIGFAPGAPASSAFSINGGAWTSGVCVVSPCVANTVQLGDKVQLRLSASASYGTSTSTTLVIGGVSATFSVTSADSNAAPFSFTPQTGVAPGSLVVSNSAIVQGPGIGSSASISVQGGEYSINGGSFTSQPGRVTLASQVRLRLSAASAYGASTSASLSVGNVVARFTVTTQTITPVSSPSQVFVNPQTTTLNASGVVGIGQAPSGALQLAANAPDNALISFDTDAAVAVAASSASGAPTLVYTRQSSDAALQVRTLNGSKTLAVVQGMFGVQASSSGSNIPVVIGTTGAATLTTQSANTALRVSLDAVRNTLVAVPTNSAPVLYTSNASTSASARTSRWPSAFTVYPGEAVQTSAAGSPTLLRLGSLNQNTSQPGDYLSAVPHASAELQVPRIAGTPPRFNESLSDRLARVLANYYGLSGSNPRLEQNASSGVLTLTVGSRVLRLLPLGPIEIDLGTSSRVDPGTIGDSAQQVAGEGLIMAIAPALVFDVLQTALASFDAGAAATLEIRGDAVARFQATAGSVFAIQPAAELVGGGVLNSPGFDQVNGQFALRDSSGYRQVLYPAFADATGVAAIFRSVLGLPDLSLRNAGAGNYETTLGGVTFRLHPNLVLAPSSAAGCQSTWWVDAAGLINVCYPGDSRYPLGLSQGFGVGP